MQIPCRLEREIHEGVFREERTIPIAPPRGGMLEAFVPASDAIAADLKELGHGS